MTKMIVITDEQINDVRHGLDVLVEKIEDESLPQEERFRYFEEWRGARHVLRSLGLSEVYSNYNIGCLNPF